MRTLFLIIAFQMLAFADQANTQNHEQKSKSSSKQSLPAYKKQRIPEKIEDTEDQQVYDQQENREENQTLVDDGFQKNFVRTLVAVFVIIILALIALWIIKKMSSGHRFSMNSKRNIKVLEHRAISGQTVLYHLEVGGKQIIMAESKANVKTITELDWAMADSPQGKKL